MSYRASVGSQGYRFADLREVLAKASPARSGDVLAGIAAQSAAERMAGRLVLADLPLRSFLDAALIPYEIDEVTRLIHDTIRPDLTVGLDRSGSSLERARRGSPPGVEFVEHDVFVTPFPIGPA